jgi:hypothetical protein
LTQPTLHHPWDTDYIVSVLVKVAGTDGDQFSLGVPFIPIPLTISLTTPALTIFSQMIQEGRVETEVMVSSAKAGMKEKIPSLRGILIIRNTSLVLSLLPARIFLNPKEFSKQLSHCLESDYLFGS